jgi:hypothetical protein
LIVIYAAVAAMRDGPTLKATIDGIAPAIVVLVPVGVGFTTYLRPNKPTNEANSVVERACEIIDILSIVVNPLCEFNALFAAWSFCRRTARHRVRQRAHNAQSEEAAKGFRT